MQTFSFPWQLRSQSDRRISTSAHKYIRLSVLAPVRPLASSASHRWGEARQGDIVRAPPKIHCPSTESIERSPQLTRIEISTLLCRYTGEVLEGAPMQELKVCTTNTARGQADTSNHLREIAYTKEAPGNPVFVYPSDPSPVVCSTGRARVRLFVCTATWQWLRAASSALVYACTSVRVLIEDKFLPHTDASKETTFQLTETSSP